MSRPIRQIEVNYCLANPLIQENNEKLVRIQENQHPRIFTKSIYYSQHVPNSLKDIYLREATYKKVMQAIELLPEQYSFILFDGYRPIQVQQYLFNHYYEEMRKVYPHFTENEILGETLKYVAFPTMNDDRPAPHLTGGAVDLTLGDQEGNPLNMGTDFDEMHESSATDYFEAHPGVNDEARKNRRILYNCMREVGFTNYSAEWWHYDYGNFMWAKRLAKEYAIYGALNVQLTNH